MNNVVSAREERRKAPPAGAADGAGPCALGWRTLAGMVKPPGHSGLRRLFRGFFRLDPDEEGFLVDAPPPAPSFAWRDARGGLELVASGVAASFEHRGPDAVLAAKRWCSWIDEHCLSEGRIPADLPIAVGGFAFATGRARQERTPPTSRSPWRGWPEGWLFVPRRLHYRRRGPSGEVEAGVVVASAEPGSAMSLALGSAARRRSRRASSARGTVSAEALATSAPATSALGWRVAVEAALAAERGGAFGKVVVARAVTHRAAPGWCFDVPATLARLHALHPASTSFALGRRGGWLVGATPETIVRLDEGVVETEALAGTAPRGADTLEDDALGAALRASDKDRLEHDLVVADVRDRLAATCDDVAVGPLELARLRNVQHLRAALTGRARPGTHVLELLAALHPTAALGGAPAEPALAWLARHDPVERGWYAGPVGWIAPDGGGAFVAAIRAALVAGGTAASYAGAGIVPGSSAEAEWRETEAKLRAVREALMVRRATEASP
jgi:isochorismate synthase